MVTILLIACVWLAFMLVAIVSGISGPTQGHP